MSEMKRRSAVRLLPGLLWTLLNTHPWGAVGLGIITVINSLMPAGELLILQVLLDGLDEVMGTGRAGFFNLLPWILALVGMALLSTVLDMAAGVIRVDVQERVGIRLQRRVIDKVQAVDLAHFEDPDFYDALKRANEDMSGRLMSLLQVVFDIVGAVLALGTILAVLLTGHWALAPIVLLGSVPGVWAMMKMNKKTHWVYRVRTPEYRQSIYRRELLTERDPAKEMRLFTLANHLLDDWRVRVVKLAQERRQLEVKQAWLGGLTDGVSGWAYSLCLGILAWLVARAHLSIGQYGMLTRGVQQFTMRLEQIMRSLGTLHEQSLYLGDLFEFLGIEAPDEDMGPEGQGMEMPRYATLRFEQVSFHYPGSEQLVLVDLDLEIRPGEHLALVGENGAGKTTLVKLMMGLYKPTSGRIMLGERPLQEWPQRQVRRLFAAVFQDFVRYQFPVRDNIVFGAWGEKGETEMRQAADLAGAAEFIEAMEEQYDTLLGKQLGGEDLSMGQWQRLATARALVREAEFIVLDEPTAALDPKAEAEVYRRFDEMTHGKASVMISHRLGSARIADRIVVLKDGALIEQGSHDELMRGDGEYSRLFRLQAQWYE